MHVTEVNHGQMKVGATCHAVGHTPHATHPHDGEHLPSGFLTTMAENGRTKKNPTHLIQLPAFWDPRLLHGKYSTNQL